MYSKNLRRCLAVVALLCGLSQTIAANTRKELAVSAIPVALRFRADAVVREYEEEIEVVNALEVKINRHYTITLLNAAAADARHLADYSSALQTIGDINATIYDASGEEVKHIRRRDFKTRPFNIGGPGFSDAELKEYLVDYAVYPFTIEFISSVTCLHSFLLPPWSPQDPDGNGRIAIEHANLKVTAPASSGFRFRSYGTDTPTVQQKAGVITWQWSIAAKPAIKTEPFSVNTVYYTPTILMSLDEVALDSYKGSAATWNSLGGFIYNLNKDRDILSPEDKIRVHALTDKLTTSHGKIEILYRHLQQHMRYVAVEIGVGGWQTLDAGFVGKNQYGDCKGLSNYMMAMLKEAGITAYPVIISAGEDYKPLVRDFPAPYFNHEILCVPAPHDTTWLECTSNDAPAGYLGAFTQDRDGLMLTEAGGILVHTPALDTDQNLLQRTIHAKMDSHMGYDMKLESRYSGYWCDKLLPHIQHLDDARLRQFVSNKFTLPAYTVNTYHYEPVDNPLLPVWKETIGMNATAMATESEKRLFVTPVLMPLSLPDFEEEITRRTDFCIQHSYTIADSFIIEVQPGRVVEHLPGTMSLNTAYGSFYSNTIFSEEGRITVCRKFVVLAGNYPAKDYPAFTAFVEKIRRSERDKVVLRTP